MKTRMSSRLAILARRAELGRGKTRLAATVGPERALEIYRHLIGLTATAARASGLPTTVYFDPAPGDLDVWPDPPFSHARQPTSADLGIRIATALLRELEAGGGTDPSGAIVIGTDAPELTGSVLAEAATALEQYDAVLGPSIDGGFYLLGVRSLPVDLFDGVAWSTDGVADAVREAFRQNRWRWRELPVLRDVDTEEDWAAYRATLPSPAPKPT